MWLSKYQPAAREKRLTFKDKPIKVNATPPPAPNKQILLTTKIDGNDDFFTEELPVEVEED